MPLPYFPGGSFTEHKKYSRKRRIKNLFNLC